MLKRCSIERRRWLASVLGASALLAAGAAPAAPAIETFHAGTWAAQFARPARPAVVVFSTTECVHCPGVIRGLADRLRQYKMRGMLVAVVMDGFTPDELAQHAHYRLADRLMAFEGPLPALRHSVNPAWRGVAPYVAFLLPGLPVDFVVGVPAAERVEAWMAAARAGGALTAQPSKETR